LEEDTQGESEKMKRQVAATEEVVQTESPSSKEIAEFRHLLDQEKRKSEEYLTRIKYLQADFENYRKRTERELREMEDFSTTRLVLKLLPVMDELELATIAKGEKDNAAIVEGVAMVLKNLTAALETEGLKPIEAIGKPFDPKLHEAMDRVEADRVGGDVVIEEIRRGYTFRHRLLRPSLVKVELGKREEKDDKVADEEVE
jgi:molecular chaperone GrpE